MVHKKSTLTLILVVITFLTLAITNGCDSGSEVNFGQVETEDEDEDINESELQEKENESTLDDIPKEFDDKVVVNVDYLRLRSGPSTDHDILDRFMKGDILKQIGRENEWIQVIAPDGKEGWVHGDYLIFGHVELDLKDELRGNSVGNIMNHGIAAIQDEWIYYVNDFHGNRIYKIKIDGSDRTQVNDESSRYINVIGDWIYYSNPSKVFKIRKDGSERTQITYDIPSPQHISVVGDWIYYRINPGSKIHRIRTDGSDLTKLDDLDSDYLNVVDGWIYYLGRSGSFGSYTGYGIYGLRSDGSEQVLISKDHPWHINVVDDWIYYCNWDDNHRVYKIHISGIGRTKVNDDNTSAINVVGNTLYYSIFSNSPNKGIYKMSVDGGNPTKVINDSVWHFCVVGDWIYYYNHDDDKKIYRARTDGSERQPIY